MGWDSRNCAMWRAFLACSRMRRWRVFMPRMARKQSKGLGTAPMPFWRKRRRVLISSELVSTMPITTSE